LVLRRTFGTRYSIKQAESDSLRLPFVIDRSDTLARLIWKTLPARAELLAGPPLQASSGGHEKSPEIRQAALGNQTAGKISVDLHVRALQKPAVLVVS
jgi:hypothetical protein